MNEPTPNLIFALTLIRDLPKDRQDELTEAVLHYVNRHTLPVIR